MAETRLEIPGYSIEREIGRGGMARVYLAVQKKFGRLVAIKVVSPEYTADPSFGKRFVREARIIAQLSHPNIVQVHDAGVNDQCYYLVMEYLRGGDLNRRLKRGLHMQAAISVVKDIARGLDNAHSKGFVHRDIKPENILFREDGSAVLSDFGVARVISSGASITRHGTVVGTPQYMSPEQATGRPLDGRSDIYSLGVVFYRMLTGEVPFKADSAVAVGIRHLQDPVPRLPGHLSSMQNVVDRFLAKKPEARFQTGAEVIEALDGVRAAGMVPNTVIKTEVVNTAEIRAIGDSVSMPVLRDGRTIRAEPDQRPKQDATTPAHLAVGDVGGDRAHRRVELSVPVESRQRDRESDDRNRADGKAGIAECVASGRVVARRSESEPRCRRGGLPKGAGRRFLVLAGSHGNCRSRDAVESEHRTGVGGRRPRNGGSETDRVAGSISERRRTEFAVRKTLRSQTRRFVGDQHRGAAAQSWSRRSTVRHRCDPGVSGSTAPQSRPRRRKVRTEQAR